MDGYMDKIDGVDEYINNLKNEKVKKKLKNKFEKHEAINKKGKTEDEMEFENFEKTKGKCRYGSKGNYNKMHAYRGGGKKDKFQKNIKT